MCGAIPPLPQYAFMAWCSVKKAQGQLYLYLRGYNVSVSYNNLDEWMVRDQFLAGTMVFVSSS
jgi:hypothetical protein